jgi:hypothetical protein
MSFDLGRSINTHIDPYLKYLTGVHFVRLFKETYNPYTYYQQENNGEIFLKQGDSIHMKLVVEDLMGMRDSVVWLMVGDSTGTRLRSGGNFASSRIVKIEAGKDNQFKEGNWTVNLPSSSFYHNFDLKLQARSPKANMLSPGIQIHYAYTPLHAYIDISYELPEEWIKLYGEKLCAVNLSGGGLSYEGGTVQGNKLHFRTRSFGVYAIYYDQTPPRVTPLSLNRNLQFRANDNLSGVDRYICSIDDKWVLLEYEPKVSSLFGRIPDWVKSGKHQLKLVVIDGKGNRTEINREIYL